MDKGFISAAYKLLSRPFHRVSYENRDQHWPIKDPNSRVTRDMEDSKEQVFVEEGVKSPHEHHEKHEEAGASGRVREAEAESLEMIAPDAEQAMFAALEIASILMAQGTTDMDSILRRQNEYETANGWTNGNPHLTDLILDKVQMHGFKTTRAASAPDYQYGVGEEVGVSSSFANPYSTTLTETLRGRVGKIINKFVADGKLSYNVQLDKPIDFTSIKEEIVDAIAQRINDPAGTDIDSLYELVDQDYEVSSDGTINVYSFSEDEIGPAYEQTIMEGSMKVLERFVVAEALKAGTSIIFTQDVELQMQGIDATGNIKKNMIGKIKKIDEDRALALIDIAGQIYEVPMAAMEHVLEEFRAQVTPTNQPEAETPAPAEAPGMTKEVPIESGTMTPISPAEAMPTAEVIGRMVVAGGGKVWRRILFIPDSWTGHGTFKGVPTWNLKIDDFVVYGREAKNRDINNDATWLKEVNEMFASVISYYLQDIVANLDGEGIDVLIVGSRPLRIIVSNIDGVGIPTWWKLEKYDQQLRSSGKEKFMKIDGFLKQVESKLLQVKSTITEATEPQKIKKIFDQAREEWERTRPAEAIVLGRMVVADTQARILSEIRIQISDKDIMDFLNASGTSAENLISEDQNKVMAVLKDVAGWLKHKGRKGQEVFDRGEIVFEVDEDQLNRIKNLVKTLPGPGGEAPGKEASIDSNLKRVESKQGSGVSTKKESFQLLKEMLEKEAPYIPVEIGRKLYQGVIAKEGMF